MTNRANVLGIAASLRNARWASGTKDLIASIKRCRSQEELYSLVSHQSDLHLENFVAAGRREGKPFAEIYANLRKNKGDKGLSNSEVALASALWSAYREGVDIDHVSLSEHFLSSGETRHLDELCARLLAADAVIVSGPVYFGDRGSLTQSLVEMIREDSVLRRRMAGKIYAGIAVGAKRNGGQETTLIYQMLDFANSGFWVVGNDTEETAQYGGTGCAGDVGTMHKDSYGLKTSMGTGRRVAKLVRELGKVQIVGSPKVLFLVLQDRGGEARARLECLTNGFHNDIEVTIVDISDQRIMPCIACDICPTRIDVDEVYRCVISSTNDSMPKLHRRLLSHDAIIPVVLSSRRTQGFGANYQKFMERTRYLRRGDYAFSDQLVAPLVFEEIGAGQNYALRIMTSMIRHHTVIAKPMIGFVHDGDVLNAQDLTQDLSQFVKSARRLAAARVAAGTRQQSRPYNPVGYVLSADKEAEDAKRGNRMRMLEARQQRSIREAAERLAS